MGYMTVVTILNDGWHVIKNNKEELIDSIENGMHGIERVCGSPHLSKKMVTRHSIKNYSSCVIVNRSFHADEDTLLYVGQNNMKNLTHSDADTDIDTMLTRMRDINRAKDLLARSEENMYYQIAEQIVRKSKMECSMTQEDKTEKDVADCIEQCINEVVKKGADGISGKKLRNAIKRFK